MANDVDEDSNPPFRDRKRSPPRISTAGQKMMGTSTPFQAEFGLSSPEATKKQKTIEDWFQPQETPCCYEEVWPGLPGSKEAATQQVLSYREKLTSTQSSTERQDEDLVKSFTYGNGDNNEDFMVTVDPNCKYGCPSFRFSDRVLEWLNKPFQFSLIVKLLGRNIGYKALENRLQKMWAKAGVISLVHLGNGFFLVKFTAEEDYWFALTEGPWMIYDHYLTMRCWSPKFDPETASIDRVVAWVRIPKLPLQYYNDLILSFIGSKFGNAVKVDTNTSIQAWNNYARFCVELDLTKPLLPSFKLFDKEFKVEYEGLHAPCLSCGCYGHQKELCSVRQGTLINEQNETEKMMEQPCGPQPQPAQTSSTPIWTVVQKSRRQRQRQVKTKVADNKGASLDGSRFGVLATLEEEPAEMSGMKRPRSATTEARTDPQVLPLETIRLDKARRNPQKGQKGVSEGVKYKRQRGGFNYEYPKL